MQLPARLGGASKQFQKSDPADVKRSRFDLSRITNLTADAGMIIPFDWFETLPNDSIDLGVDYALETMPTVTNILTPYRVLIHWYYIRNSDLWKGWDNFITKGRAGNVNLRLPQVYVGDIKDPAGGYWSSNTPHSLSSFLGVPPHWYQSDREPDLNKAYLPYAHVSDSASPVYDYNVGSLCVSALPFMAYQSVVKYNYVPQNLLQNLHALFPEEGDYDWLLPYSISENVVDGVSAPFVSAVSGLFFDSYLEFDPFTVYGIYRDTDSEVSLTALRYACFDDDVFTTAMPWLQRGDVQTLSSTVDFTGVSFPVTITYPSRPDTPYRIYGLGPLDKIYSEYPSTWSSGIVAVNPDGGVDSPVGYALSATAEKGQINDIGLGITASQLRELLAMSVWQERNATVNGDYNSMIWIHWRHDPKQQNHYPVFVGGTSDYISFSEVLQTSETSQDSALGEGVGRGTLRGSSNCGRFQCPDYGIMMGIMIIKPMTTYNAGIEYSLSRHDTMESFAFPEFEQLSLQPVESKELYVEGDNELFGYQVRDYYLKQRTNQNRGLFRLKSTEDIVFSSATQAREFASVPKLSYQFSVMSPANMRRDWLAYPSQPMFKVQVASKVFATRGLSYAARPNDFGF